MKCPKCGSTNVSTERRPNGFSTCNKCGYRWQRGTKQPEPTTAEMLLWLVENGYTIYRYPHKTRVFGYVHNPLTLNYPFNFGKGEDYATLEDAVRAAYAEARKQEVKE